MSIFKKRSIIVVSIIVSVTIVTIYLFLIKLSNDSRNLREVFLLRDSLKMTSIALDLELSNHSDTNESVKNYMLSNILSYNEEPLLSWRVKLLRNNPDTQRIYERFVLNAKWNARENFTLIDDKPTWYYYPYYLKEHKKSCVVGIEEIMSLDKTMMIQNVFKEKAIIVLIYFKR